MMSRYLRYTYGSSAGRRESPLNNDESNCNCDCRTGGVRVAALRPARSRGARARVAARALPRDARGALSPAIGVSVFFFSALFYGFLRSSLVLPAFFFSMTPPARRGWLAFPDQMAALVQAILP